MFDVVTVCYDDDERLAKTLKSLEFLHFPGQIIVQDGSCLASTRELIAKFSHLDICHIRMPDNGLYDAMNKAAARVSSPWFLTLNCGDILLSVIDPTPFQGDLILCDVLLRTRNGTETFSARPERIGDFMSVCHQGILFSKATFDEFGGYDTSFKVAADYDLLRRMLPKCQHDVLHFELTEFEGFDGLSERHRWTLEMETARIRFQHGLVLSYVIHLARYLKFRLLNRGSRT